MGEFSIENDSSLKSSQFFLLLNLIVNRASHDMLPCFPHVKSLY